MKYVKVPEADIKKIEEARQELWTILNSIELNGVQEPRIYSVTQKMYRIGNRKYKKVILF